MFKIKLYQLWATQDESLKQSLSEFLLIVETIIDCKLNANYNELFSLKRGTISQIW